MIIVGLNKRMNKHIQNLERYIKTGSTSASCSLFFEDFKRFYNEKFQELKDMVNTLERYDAGINDPIIDKFLSLWEKNSMVTCFVFAVYPKHKAEEDAISNSDIIKVLPPRGYKKFKKILYDEGFMSSILTGAALGILCGIIFFRKCIV